MLWQRSNSRRWLGRAVDAHENESRIVVPLPSMALELLTKRRTQIPDDEPRVFPALS